MYSLGIDIGGTKCAVSLGKGAIPENKKDFIIDKKRFPTNNNRGVSAVLKDIFDFSDKMLINNNINKEDLSGIGISCGGPLNSKKGIILSPPNLKSWDNIEIVKMFEEKYNTNVRLQNDANACCVAEWKFGAAKGYSNIIFLTFGTGMGAGLILNGKLYSGTNDMAGEVGHIRLADDGPEGFGKRGSFEGFCSGGGIARMAKEDALIAISKNETSLLFENESHLENITAKTLADALYAGDTFAHSVYKKCAEKLGLGLSILIDILNPEIIVIGSIYERNSDFFDEHIMRVIKKEALYHSSSVCRIAPAALGDSIGDYAALSLAIGDY